MPSADAPFDDVDPSPAAPSSRKGKKKKAKQLRKDIAPPPQQQQQQQEEDDDVEPLFQMGVEEPEQFGVKVEQQEGVEVPEVVEEAGIGHEEEDVQVEQPPAPPPPSKPQPSPRTAAARPVTLSPPSRPAGPHKPSPPQHYATLASHRNSTPRRESLAARSSPGQRFVEPAAPPHKAQPHFYNLPDLGLNFGQKKGTAGKAAGSDGYCCCFDSFADAGDLASAKKAKHALLVGSEGGLEVFRVLPNKFEVVGRLEGLRGSVIGAKILPCVDLFDAVRALRPLVAVVVHGAQQTEKEDEEPTYFQTTVEVYSLQTQEHVATLYKSVAVPAEQPAIGHLAKLPPPIGDLSISAKGRFVVVASGKSGEIFVFSHAATFVNPEPQFRCLGKFWTSLQSPPENPAARPPSSSDAGSIAEETEERPGVPLFSLSQRWLALVAPATSSHISIQGTPLLSDRSPYPPGLATHVAPPQPLISCDVAGVDAEGTWSRLTRQAAQGVVKYSQKGIEMGWQGWKELTNPTAQGGQQQQQQQQHARTSSREDQFPPTKAPPDDPGRFAKEPAIVSIVDLDSLLEFEEQKPKYLAPPLAAFALEEGCNFLAFSSSSLRLLTVSRKGEVSTIWDLVQAPHGVATHRMSNEAEEGPCVKQIQRIVRKSQAVVVDCAWSRDDDYLALLTTQGTVHLHEIPSRPPTRKRKRRSTITPTPEKAQPTVSLSQGLSPPSSNGFLGSIKSWGHQAANPVTSLGIPTTFAGFKEATTSASQAGTRALARGFSQGYSAAKGGASDYWHAEDNKIRHRALQEARGAAGQLRWIKRQSGSSLGVVCGGTVHLHPVQRLERRKGDVMVSGLKHDRYGRRSFELPPIISDDACPADATGPHGFWSLRLVPEKTVRVAVTEPKNEVETNPPYCPFHIDSRVGVFASAASSQQHMEVFGGSLPPATKMNLSDADAEEFGEGGVGDEELEGLARQVESRVLLNSEGEIRVRSSSRRSRGGDGEAEGVGWVEEE